MTAADSNAGDHGHAQKQQGAIHQGFATQRPERSMSNDRPRWGSCLALLPSSLNLAYWETHAQRHRYWDMQVAFWCLMPLLLLTFQLVPVQPWTSTVVALGPAWLVAAFWVTMLRCHPRFYCRHRATILVSVRLLLSAALLHSSSSSSHSSSSESGGEGSSDGSSMPQESMPLIMLMAHMLVVTHVHVAAETFSLMLPFLLQFLVTASKPLMLLSGGVLSGLVSSLNTQESLSVVDALTAFWIWLVQSGHSQQVPDSPRLQGRSSTVLLAAAITYSTTVCVTMYVYYMHLWADLVQWLAGVAATQSDTAPRSTWSSNGEALQSRRERLLGLCWTPAANLLLRRQGWMSLVSWVCFHGSAINILCLACVLVSQHCVKRLLPAVLSELALDVWYPPVPLA